MKRRSSSIAPSGSLLIAITLVWVTALGPKAFSSGRGDTRTLGGDTVARFLQSGHPALTAYRARRHLEASSKGGNLNAQLDAWTELSSDGSFTFEVIQESGSGLIRNHVLRAALLEEQRSGTTGEVTDSALSPQNYEFQADEAAGEGELVRIALSPRRKSQLLITGDAFVRRDDADLVSVEGVLSKRPSFWTRKVEVARRYARIEGVRVPVEMQSRADILLVGDSAFSMTYQYTTINGRPLRVD
jgi:hypothetical protein